MNMGNSIEHHGVKGMKWGVRKSSSSSGGNKRTKNRAKKRSLKTRLNKNKNRKVSSLKKSGSQRARNKVSDILMSDGMATVAALSYAGLIAMAYTAQKNKPK